MNSTGNSSVCDKQVSAFLAEYRKPETGRRFETLAALTRGRCEELLQSMSTKGVVQYRAKKYDSLEKKLKDMTKDPSFRDWVTKEKDIYKHDEMGDLAGVRIGLYLPRDVVKVAKEIQKRFDMKRLFGTVTGGRGATEGRKLDLQKHGNGPWYSQDVNGADEHWEHYGYKSWKMVVEWKKPLPKGVTLSRVEIR